MQSEQRLQIKRRLDALEDCVGEFAQEENKLCEPSTHPNDAIGTDGTLWTDEQLREYAKKLCQNVNKTLRRI